MSRHPLNPSIDERMERHPKTIALVKEITNKSVSPTIEIYDLLNSPRFAFSDAGEALAHMRHACRIIVDRGRFTFLLVTTDTFKCVGHYNRTRKESEARCEQAITDLARSYVADCAARHAEIQSLYIIAMPLGVYHDHDGLIADQYGVSMGVYADDDLALLQVSLGLHALASA